MTGASGEAEGLENDPEGFVIRTAGTPDDLETVRTLFLEYQRSIGIDLCFQGFRQELDLLPGVYAPPAGRLVLALAGCSPAGCAALRPAGEGTAEMKRLYLRPAFRGKGRGRRLVEHLLASAREIGYRTVVLDTLEPMIEARALYRKMGFEETAPFGVHPIPGTIFLALEL
jgi:GNAT superfamily N-acetyltransferase